MAAVQEVTLVVTVAYTVNYNCSESAFLVCAHTQTGESLVEGDHYASGDIEARVEELFAKWEELLEATDSKRLGLEQALSLVHFNRKVKTLKQ